MWVLKRPTRVLWDGTFYRPYPRRLESPTNAHVITEAAFSPQLFKDPECLSGRGLNLRSLTQHSSALATELTGRRLGNGIYMHSYLEIAHNVVIPLFPLQYLLYRQHFRCGSLATFARRTLVLVSPPPPPANPLAPKKYVWDWHLFSFMQVKDIQRKNLQDRFLKKQVFATLKSEHLPDDVTFCCRKCNIEACQAHDIRTIKESHHVVVNRGFRDSKVKSSPVIKCLWKSKILPSIANTDEWNERIINGNLF